MSKNSLRISWKEADLIRQEIDGLAIKLKLKEYVVAGSYRRKRETCGDIDLCVREQDYGKWALGIVCLAEKGSDVLIKQKDGTVTGILYHGTRIELYVALKDSFGAMLMFCTGSWELNVRQRQRAVSMGLKLNEKGLFRGEEKIAGKTEKDVYVALGLEYLEPEDREV